MASGDLINILQEVRGFGIPGGVPTEGYYFEIALNSAYTTDLDPAQKGMYGAVVSMYTDLFGDPTDSGSTGMYDELVAIHAELTTDAHNGNDGVYGDILVKYSEFLTKLTQFNIDYAAFLVKFNQLDFNVMNAIIANKDNINAVGGDLLKNGDSTVIAVGIDLLDPTGVLVTVKDAMDPGKTLYVVYQDLIASYSNIENAKANADIAKAEAEKAVVSAEAARLSAEAAKGGEVHAGNAQLSTWAAQAEALTAESHASQGYGEFVRKYTSNGDGTFSHIELTTKSAMHYSIVAQA